MYFSFNNISVLVMLVHKLKHFSFWILRFLSETVYKYLFYFSFMKKKLYEF